MSAAADPTIQTPNVYLNHLSPEQIPLWESTRNFYIAVIGALACDVVSHIPADIKAIKQSSGFITPACFALVRLFAIVYMALYISMYAAPVANCSGLAFAGDAFCLVTMTMTSFLFLRRVQAVYHNNRGVKYGFTLLWIVSSGIVAMLIPGIHAKHLPGTGYCIIYESKRYVPISNFMPAVFDTLVFLAISYKIVFQHNQEMEGLKWTRSWFSTKTLPVVSRAILQGGQQYYLVTFIFNILSGAFSFSPSVPPMHQALFAIPSVAFSACMACHAHRVLVTAYLRDVEAAPPMLSAFVAAGSAGSGTAVPSHAIIEVEKGYLGGKRTSVES